MKYAAIDTEGSGLFVFKAPDGKPVPADDPSQPRLAALSILMLNDDPALAAVRRGDGW